MDTLVVETCFAHKLASASKALKTHDFPKARADIAETMMLNPDAPEPHNLLGIYYEMTGDYCAARKHYRAGYALDPTYKPCCRNLERITGFDAGAYYAGRVFDAVTNGSEERSNRT